MKISRKYVFQNGTTSDAKQLNYEIDQIIHLLNGNLDSDNVNISTIGENLRIVDTVQDLPFGSFPVGEVRMVKQNLSLYAFDGETWLKVAAPYEDQGIVEPTPDDGNYEDGYNKGYMDGYLEGKTEIQEGSKWENQPPGNRNYDTGYADGYYDGTVKGKQQGLEEGKSTGYNSGYADGEIAGYNRGYADGSGGASHDGYDQGYAKGVADGLATGYQSGLVDGYGQGHAIGWEEGYQAGLLVGGGGDEEEPPPTGEDDSHLSEEGKLLVPVDFSAIQFTETAPANYNERDILFSKYAYSEYLKAGQTYDYYVYRFSPPKEFYPYEGKINNEAPVYIISNYPVTNYIVDAYNQWMFYITKETFVNHYASETWFDESNLSKTAGQVRATYYYQNTGPGFKFVYKGEELTILNGSTSGPSSLYSGNLPNFSEGNSKYLLDRDALGDNLSTNPAYVKQFYQIEPVSVNGLFFKNHRADNEN